MSVEVLLVAVLESGLTISAGRKWSALPSPTPPPGAEIERGWKRLTG
jgi:hypothetical protein